MEAILRAAGLNRWRIALSELRTAASCLNRGGMHDENRIQTNSDAESAYFQAK